MSGIFMALRTTPRQAEGPGGCCLPALAVVASAPSDREHLAAAPGEGHHRRTERRESQTQRREPTDVAAGERQGCGRTRVRETAAVSGLAAGFLATGVLRRCRRLRLAAL